MGDDDYYLRWLTADAADDDDYYTCLRWLTLDDDDHYMYLRWLTVDAADDEVDIDTGRREVFVTKERSRLTSRLSKFFCRRTCSYLRFAFSHMRGFLALWS